MIEMIHSCTVLHKATRIITSEQLKSHVIPHLMEELKDNRQKSPKLLALLYVLFVLMYTPSFQSLRSQCSCFPLF